MAHGRPRTARARRTLLRTLCSAQHRDLRYVAELAGLDRQREHPVERLELVVDFRVRDGPAPLVIRPSRYDHVGLPLRGVRADVGRR